MHTILSLMLSAVLPSLRDRAALRLELIALRHQLTVLERKPTARPRLNRFGRSFRVWLYHLWPGCQLIPVAPRRVFRCLNPPFRQRMDKAWATR